MKKRPKPDSNDWKKPPHPKRRNLNKTLKQMLIFDRKITGYATRPYNQGRRNEKSAGGGGGQNVLKDTDKVLNMLKSIPGDLEGRLHFS